MQRGKLQRKRQTRYHAGRGWRELHQVMPQAAMQWGAEAMGDSVVRHVCGWPASLAHMFASEVGGFAGVHGEVQDACCPNANAEEDQHQAATLAADLGAPGLGQGLLHADGEQAGQDQGDEHACGAQVTRQVVRIGASTGSLAVLEAETVTHANDGWQLGEGLEPIRSGAT